MTLFHINNFPFLSYITCAAILSSRASLKISGSIVVSISRRVLVVLTTDRPTSSIVFSPETIPRPSLWDGSMIDGPQISLSGMRLFATMIIYFRSYFASGYFSFNHFIDHNCDTPHNECCEISKRSDMNTVRYTESEIRESKSCKRNTRNIVIISKYFLDGKEIEIGVKEC